jgi:hypothetical protein
MNVRRGVRKKQVQTDRGKVLKSRMLGVHTAQLEAVRNCDQSVQRPGVRTRVMCRRHAEIEENLFGNQDTAGDNGPRGDRVDGLGPPLYLGGDVTGVVLSRPPREWERENSSSIKDAMIARERLCLSVCVSV